MHCSTADEHCVPDIHHAKCLNAFDEVLQHVHVVWSRQYGANQPPWLLRDIFCHLHRFNISALVVMQAPGSFLLYRLGGIWLDFPHRPNFMARILRLANRFVPVNN